MACVSVCAWVAKGAAGRLSLIQKLLKKDLDKMEVAQSLIASKAFKVSEWGEGGRERPCYTRSLSYCHTPSHRLGCGECL